MHCRSSCAVVRPKYSHQTRAYRRRWISLTTPLVVLYLVVRDRYSWLPGWSCPIRHATGLPCPGCYLTRSISYSLTGQLGEALYWHVMGPPIAITLLGFCGLTIFGQPVIWTKKLRFVLLLLLLSLFVVWIVRLILQIVFHVRAFPIDPLLSI